MFFFIFRFCGVRVLNFMFLLLNFAFIVVRSLDARFISDRYTYSYVYLMTHFVYNENHPFRFQTNDEIQDEKSCKTI